jgi:DNA-binding Lrp family transcriptional regulator
MKQYEIDATGEAILDILRADARITPSDIAKQLGVPEADVKKHIAKFEKDRIILDYKTVINWQKIHKNTVCGLIEVKVTPERNVGFDAVAETIYRFPEVSSLSLLSGGYDLLVEVEGESLEKIARFIAVKLATIKGVQSTVSHFILKRYKENGVIFEEQRETKRLPVAP